MSAPDGKRPPLLRRFVGKKACAEVPGNPKIKLCVVGGKYGFSAWITDRAGKNLAPVSTGESRTLRQAMEYAQDQVKRVQTRRN